LARAQKDGEVICLYGPLDGFDCPPGMILRGKATLGLKVIKVKGEYPHLEGEPASHQHDRHVIYVMREARLEYKETKR
jgi:hypothetical protein